MKRKNVCKKITSRMLLLLILFSIFENIALINASATQNRSANFSRNYSLTGNYANDIVAVAQAQLGKTKSQLGYTEAWCADFVTDCARLTGMPDSVIPYNYASRGACTYLHDYMINKCGAKQVSDRRAGDLVFYYCSLCKRYVHVGIVMDGTNSIEGNYGNKVTKVQGSYSHSNGHSLKAGTVKRIYVRPNYPTIDDPTPQPVDLGTDFYAYIINTSVWKHLTNDFDNASFRTETGEANQVWKFNKQSDGSYTITNCANSKVLDVYNLGSSSLTNVWVTDKNGSDAQKWYIYGEQGAYYLKPKCSDCVLDMNTGIFSEGVNAQIYEKNDTVAQKFNIWQLNKPGSTYLHSNDGTNYTPITFWWDATSDTKSYSLRIFKDKVWEGEEYGSAWELTETTYTTNLPAGYYEAYIDSVNNYSYSKSENILQFTITEGTPVDLGNDFYAYIINTSAWKSMINDGSGNVCFSESSEVIQRQKDIWHFTQNSNGSYKITSVYDGNVLDVDDSGSESETNVKVWWDNGCSAQEWYIYGVSAAYYLKPGCSDCLLDMQGGVFTEGVNAQIYEKNYTDAQKFQIYKLEKPSSTKVACSPGNMYKPTRIWWNTADNANAYDIKIFKDKVFEGEECGSAYNLTDTLYSVNLPAGYYEAYVDSKNAYSHTMSENTISFTVSEGTPENISDDFYAYVINTPTGAYLANNGEGSACFNNSVKEPQKLWHFKLNDNDSYTIYSVYDGKVLDVDDSGSENGTKILLWNSNGGSNQQWYVLGSSSEYNLKPRFTDSVLDMYGGIYSEGLPANIWEKNGTDAQKFQIVPVEKPNLGIPTVIVENYYDKEGNNVKFTWNECENASGYDIKVFDESGENVLYTYWNVQGTSYVTNLPFGNYQVIICSLNSQFNFWQAGNKIPFTLSEHIHTVVTDKSVDPTCTETGLTEGKHCSVCNEVITPQEVIPAKGHTEVIDKAVEPTCTETGLTEGKHCSVCNEVITPQEVIPAKGHTEVIDKAVDPTCAETGLTEGKHCSFCNEVIKPQETVPAKGHTEVIDKALEPTCTETGLTEGKHCSVCNEIITPQEVIPAKGHTEVIDKSVDPTCTETGLTEGKHCSVCNEVITPQEVVPAKGHTEVIDKALEPTCTETGLTEGKHCSVCNEIITPQEVIPAKGHDYIDGVCTVCGDTDSEYINTDIETDTGVSTDSDTDINTDISVDTESDIDTETDTQSDSDIQTDTESDTDMQTDTDSNTDTDEPDTPDTPDTPDIPDNPNPPKTYTKGDITADGKITASDALVILRAAVGEKSLTTEENQIADVNGDGKITASDALMVLRYAVGAERNSDVGKIFIFTN